MIFFDTEYRCNRQADGLVAAVFYDSTTDNCTTFNMMDHSKLVSYIQENKHKTFSCFSAAADLPFLLTAGVPVKTLHELDFIDLHNIYKMLAYNHPKFKTARPSLVSCLRSLGLPNPYDENEKDGTVDLIISKTEYSPREMVKILAYCRKDAKALVAVWQELKTVIHGESGMDGDLLKKAALYHGDYLKSFHIADYLSDGFPLSPERTDGFFDNVLLIKRHLAKKINSKHCPDAGHLPLYVFGQVSAFKKRQFKKKHGRRMYDDEIDAIESKMPVSFSVKGFEALIKRMNISKGWELTKSGQPLLRGDYLAQKVKTYPMLEDIATMAKLSIIFRDKNDVRHLVKNKNDWYFLKHADNEFPMSTTFGTVTGRSSPRPAHGFVLNQPPVIRCLLVEPPAGKVVISCDWSAQEMFIQAELSGCPKLREVCEVKEAGGDIYLHMGYMAGLCPQDASPHEYSALRIQMKIISLGLSYGKGVASLGEDIYGASVDKAGHPTMTKSQAVAQARKLYNWHKSNFKVFWKWSENYFNKVTRVRYGHTSDGWIKFYNDLDTPNSWLNFPMQSEAARMTRELVNIIMSDIIENERTDQLICTLHDAAYLLVDEDSAETAAKRLEASMACAVETVFEGVKIPAEAHIQNHGQVFKDGRGSETSNLISKWLRWEARW